MTKKLSLVTSALVLSSSVALADATSIKDAFSKGTASGDITVFTKSTDTKGSADSGFTAGSIGVNYETETFNGFKLNAGFRAAHEFGEDTEGDYEGSIEKDSILHTLAISYTNDDFFASVGRQEIDLEWMGDYHESIVAGITSIPDTTIIAGMTNRIAVVAEDEISNGFTDVNNDKGAYVLDVKNTSVEGLELNPYFYSAPDLADWYGLKTSYENDMFGLVAHYGQSNEDVSGTPDGSILNLEVSTSIADVSLALGYIATDKDGGIGSMNASGDNIDPTEEIGDQVYGTDATSIYGSIGYEISEISLGALYIDNEYLDGTKKDAKELTLTAGYAFTEELELGITYSDYEVDNVDSDALSATLVYSF